MLKTQFDQIYAEFEASIDSPALRKVAQHWRDLCESTRLPQWSNVRPAEIKAQLPIVWCYDYDAGQDDFVGRLAGIAIAGTSTKPFKGTRLSELRPVDIYPRSLIRARRVLQEPALYRGTGLVYKTGESCGFGERIALPLDKGGMIGPGIFGATEYKNAAASPDVLPAERTEVEHWFLLTDIFSSPLAVSCA